MRHYFVLKERNIEARGFENLRNFFNLFSSNGSLKESAGETAKEMFKRSALETLGKRRLEEGL